MKKALITGGAGFIGSNLAHHLAETGEWYIDLCDNLSNGYFSFIKNLPGDKLICDFTDDMVLDRIKSQKYNCIFHLAAKPRVSYSVEYPAETTEENLNKVVKLLEACKGNVERFIFSSSSSVYGNTDILPTPEDHPKNPQSPYSLQKSCSEEFIKLFCNLYDIDAVSLRYFNVVGPNQFGDSPYSMCVSAWFHSVKNNLPLRSDWDGEQSRDICPITNVIHANLLAANHPEDLKGECFNVACEQRITNNEVLRYFKRNFPGVEVIHADKREGDVRHTHASLDKIKQVLGYEVQDSFWNYIDVIRKWWQV